MSISGRIGEVVCVVLLVQPRGLEEAAIVVVTQNGLLSLRIENHDVLNFLGELVHIVGKLANLCALSSDTFASDLLGTLPCRVIDVVALLVALELATPETTKIEVGLAIVIDEAGWVDTEAALDGLRVGGEWALGLVSDGDTDAENALLVTSGEVEVVFAVFCRAVWCPELLRDPGNILGLKHNPVICHLAGRGEAVDTEDMVVGHIILVAIVIELDVSLAIVRGIDVDLSVEDMSRGVSGVSGGDEGRHCDDLRVSVRVRLEGESQ